MASSTTATLAPFPAPPSGTQTYADNQQRTNTIAAAALLRHVVPEICLGRFPQVKPVPKNKADNVTFLRPVPFGVTGSVTPIDEGVTPSAKRINFETVAATLLQYAQVFSWTDKMVLAEDNVPEIVAGLAAEQAALTLETLLFNVAKSGTNVLYDKNSHTTRATVDSRITTTRLRAACRTLSAQGASMITDILEATTRISTEPIEAAHIAVSHTDVTPDWRDLTGYIHKSHYGVTREISSHEHGSFEGVRGLATRHFTPWQAAGAAVGATGMQADDATNIEVYPVLVFGKDWLGATPLRGMESVKTTVLPTSQTDKSDPVGQKGFFTWCVWVAYLILNQQFGVRIEVGASDLAN